jgi:Zinc finger C-x8-C-x5-C-x3-H type (and similar)
VTYLRLVCGTKTPRWPDVPYLSGHSPCLAFSFFSTSTFTQLELHGAYVWLVLCFTALPSSCSSLILYVAEVDVASFNFQLRVLKRIKSRQRTNPCRYFANGFCKLGDSCTFSHIVSSPHMHKCKSVYDLFLRGMEGVNLPRWSWLYFLRLRRCPPPCSCNRREIPALIIVDDSLRQHTWTYLRNILAILAMHHVRAGRQFWFYFATWWQTPCC